MSALPTSTNSSNQDGKIITRERIYELLCKYVRSHGSNWSRDHMKKWYNFVHKLRLSIGYAPHERHTQRCFDFRIQICEGILHLIPIWPNEYKRSGDPFPIVFQDPVLIQVRVQLLLAWRKQTGHRARKRARLAGISLPSTVIWCVFSFLLPINFTLS